jgi:MacB-like protein
LSYKFWQQSFQGRPDILGQQVRLNDKVYTVIGVLPVRFTWNDVDAYVPMDMRPSAHDYVGVFYRIKPGVSQNQIDAEFQPHPPGVSDAIAPLHVSGRRLQGDVRERKRRYFG